MKNNEIKKEKGIITSISNKKPQSGKPKNLLPAKFPKSLKTPCIVLTTTATQEEADKIASVLVKNKAAACVQISPIVSIYRWQGKIERENEMRLVIKTTEELYQYVEDLIKENHSYEVPQIVKMPITDGLTEYMDWILKETKF